MSSLGTVVQVGRVFEIKFAYRPLIAKEVKDLPERKFMYQEKYWTVPEKYRDEVERFARRHKLEFGHKHVNEAEQNFVIPPLPELTIEIPLKREMRPYQKTGVSYAMQKKRLIIADDMGLGKQSVNGTPVLANGGWKAIETLNVGDQVYGRDGKLHNVTGVFPQGLRDIYRVSFNDGTFTDCGLEHLWAVRSLNDRTRKKSVWRVMDTETIAKDLRYANGSPKWEIPIVEPIDYPESKLQIPPYILGVLIADGAITDGVRFVPGDLEVPELVEDVLDDYMAIKKGADYGTSTAYYLSCPSQFNNPYLDYIRSVKLNRKDVFKFIPDEYMNGSIEQRKELLAGLMDCDGTVSGARSRYSSSSLMLAENVKTLVQSLGGLATISKTPAKDKIRYGKISHEVPNYNVCIRTNFNPFKRESNRIKWRKSSKFIRQIINISHIGNNYATCISVDAPDHLYVVNDFIVTHNTAQSIATIIGLAQTGTVVFPCLIICPSAVKENWLKEIKDWSNYKGIILQDSIKNTFMEFFRVGMSHFFVVNYESLKKYFVERIDEPGKDANGRKKPLRINNIHFKEKYVNFFKAVIVDESHKVKSLATKNTKFTKGICTGKETILLLTGTPVVNKPKDLISQIGILDRMKDFGGYPHFTKHFCSGPKEASNLKELNYLLNIHCFYRRNKTDEDIKVYLPDKMRQVIMCELNVESRREYSFAQANLESYMREMKQRSDEEIEKSMKGEVMVRIGILKNISARGKLKDAFDFIQDTIDNGQKIVVFASLKEVIAAVQERFPNSVRVTGAENDQQKQQSVERFQHDPKIDLIVLNLKAGGVGINGLQNAATQICFIEFGWHAAIMDQAEDRLYRMGQHSNVMCTYFLGKNTIDEWNYKLINSKREIANTVTGAEDQTEESVIDGIINLFTQKN